ncbi:MAG: helix-turn-helix domain-containing protein, partial [Selenomonadaceae bacterium]|nr:helix-turn-helix domain-containing protein [Selenomonadaceae bacterium]
RRKELNISQADLAEMSGVSLRTVNGQSYVKFSLTRSDGI